MQRIKITAIIALISVFLVIIAGSIVRMTGSGMGCPDWPKCFGHLVPPTHESEVLWHPNETYKKGQFILHNRAFYSAKQDFVSTKDFKISDWEKYTRHNYTTFNATHTWIEYINRLFGALSGLPVLALFVLCLVQIRQRPIFAALSFVVVLALGFEAWLGKLLVDGNLIPHEITWHMLGSLVIVLLLVAIISMASARKRVGVSKVYRSVLFITLALLFVQIILGTQVREQIDAIAERTSNRDLWVNLLDYKVLIHRSFSLAILLLISWLYWRNFADDYSLKSIKSLFLFVFLEIVAGIILYYFSMPAFTQPLHLLLSVAMIAYLMRAIMRTRLRD